MIKILKYIFKKVVNFFNTDEMSPQKAIILSGFIVGASIFLTTWIFFGGYNNRQKLSVRRPQAAKQVPAQTPQQLLQTQQLEQQRLAALKNASASSTQVTKPATTTPVRVIKK